MYLPYEGSPRRFTTLFHFSTYSSVTLSGTNVMFNRINQFLETVFRENTACGVFLCVFIRGKAGKCPLKWSVMYQGLRYTAVAT